MIKLTIPGRDDIELEQIVFDVNGTLAMDGRIEKHVKQKLMKLNGAAKVYLLTADTYGIIEHEMGGTGIEVQKVIHPDEAKQKETFVSSLGAQKTIAVGNGENDILMLKVAVLGMCVIAEEGASSRAVQAADIVVYGREAIFDLFEHPKRIIATLRG